MSKSVDPKVAAQFRAWRINPVKFVRDNFRVEPDAWQADVLMAAVTCPRIAMKACKGPGKSCVLAWLIWWFLVCYPHAKILATSITGDNLRDNLWAELATWQKKSMLITNAFQWNAERISNKEHPESWFCSARTWAKGSDPTQQANTLAGHHAEYTMIVLDEVGDIPNSVYAAAGASLATGKKNMIVMAGNPTRTDGPLWDACTRDRKLFYVVEISGDPDNPKRSPRINVAYAREEIAKWGRENPWVLVNIFGQFPPTASDKLLGPEEVEASQRRTIHEGLLTIYPIVYGLDVAKSLTRDRSTFWKRQGPMAWLLGEWRINDTMQLADNVARLLSEEQIHGIEIGPVYVDNGGLSGVSERLLQLGWTQVVAIDFGWAATDAKFLNRRSEMWWHMADWVKKTGCLPYHEALKHELTAPKMEFRLVGNKGTRFVLESKEDMADRGIASPDLGDGLCLTFAAPASLKVPPKDRISNRYGNHAKTDYEPYGDVVPQDEEEYRHGLTRSSHATVRSAPSRRSCRHNRPSRRCRPSSPAKVANGTQQVLHFAYRELRRGSSSSHAC